MARTYDQSDIDGAVTDYAIFHEIETGAVDVNRNVTPDGEVVGFRLSRPLTDGNLGDDETFGQWR